MRNFLSLWAGFCFSTALFLLLPITPVQASGTPVGADIELNKTVKHPTNGTFVDRLSPTDPAYRPGHIITFRISIKNNKKDTLRNLTLTDLFPSIQGQPVIDFMSGPGTYSSAKHALILTIGEIKPGETKTIEVKGKIVHAALLPAQISRLCPKPGNMAQLTAEQVSLSDESTFCIEKSASISKMPNSGPESWLLTSMLLPGLFSVGWILRQKASNR